MFNKIYLKFFLFFGFVASLSTGVHSLPDKEDEPLRPVKRSLSDDEKEYPERRGKRLALLGKDDTVSAGSSSSPTPSSKEEESSGENGSPPPENSLSSEGFRAVNNALYVYDGETTTDSENDISGTHLDASLGLSDYGEGSNETGDSEDDSGFPSFLFAYSTPPLETEHFSDEDFSSVEFDFPGEASTLDGDDSDGNYSDSD